VLFYNPDIDGFETGPSLDATNGRTEGACTLFYSALHENRPVVLAVGGQSNPTPQLLDYSTENAVWENSKYDATFTLKVFRKKIGIDLFNSFKIPSF
jgi:hypothetical protein